MRTGIEIIILACLALLFSLGLNWIKKPNVTYRTDYRTDTVYIDRFIPLPAVSDPVPPEKVILQPKDSTRRAEAEQGTILRGIQFKKNKLEIHSITKKGISQVAEYPELPCSIPFTIDYAGNLQVDQKELKRIQRKEKIRRLGNKLLIGASFAAGVILASAAGQ